MAAEQPIDSPGDPQPPDEIQRLTSLLATSQKDNQRLQEEVASLRIESAKANAAPAVPHGLIAELETKLKDAEQRALAAPELVEWKQRWKAAVEKVGSLEDSLSASMRELESHKAQLAQQQVEKKDDGSAQPAPRRSAMLAGIIMAIIGAAGGFGFDRMIIPSQDQVQASISQLKSQIGGHVANIQKLTTELNSVTHEAAMMSADLTAETTARKKAEAERDQAKVTGQQNDSAAKRLASLLIRYPGAKIAENTQGVLRWDGEIKTDKGVNVVIKNGVALIASHDGTSTQISGDALPGVPVVVRPGSQNAFIVEPPWRDDWTRVVFHIDKKGHASVQLKWTVL